MNKNLPEQGLAVWSGVYDVVNVSDSELFYELEQLETIGAAPIRINKMYNGVDYMVDRLWQRVEQVGTIDLLRIHGHGGAGLQTLSWNKDLRGEDLSQSRAIISNRNFQHIQSSLRRMQGLFAPNAQVWLMGCEVGADSEGRWLVSKLAQLWRTVVIAGIPKQKAGITATYNFEGRTVTAYP